MPPKAKATAAKAKPTGLPSSSTENSENPASVTGESTEPPAASQTETSHDEKEKEATTAPKSVKKKRPLHAVEILLGETLVNGAGDKISTKTLEADDGIIGLYFGAHWCPPCRVLSPELMLLYEEVKKAGHKFEMILVSFDKTSESFTEYLAKMPWWAVDFQDEERREDLAINFNVKGIPLFVLIDAKTLDVITRNGRIFVEADPRGEKFPWRNITLESLEKPKKDAIDKGNEGPKNSVASDATEDQGSPEAAETSEAAASQPAESSQPAEASKPTEASPPKEALQKAENLQPEASQREDDPAKPKQDSETTNKLTKSQEDQNKSQTKALRT